MILTPKSPWVKKHPYSHNKKSAHHYTKNWDDEILIIDDSKDAFVHVSKSPTQIQLPSGSHISEDTSASAGYSSSTISEDDTDDCNCRKSVHL